MSDDTQTNTPDYVPPRAQVLREAESLITGDRNQTYGSPTENFQNTADIWNTLIKHKLKDGEKITATEVATFLIGLKLARTVAQPKRDNFVDMAGYAGCGWETVQAEPQELELWVGDGSEEPPSYVTKLRWSGFKEGTHYSEFLYRKATRWGWVAEDPINWGLPFRAITRTFPGTYTEVREGDDE